MKFIKKVVLKEEAVNPLDANNPDLSYDEAYKQAILKAIASETAACNEYDQILSLEDKVTTKSLVDLFHDTLVDLKDEEVKHLAQLTTQTSKVPELKDTYEAGVKEADSGEEQSAEEENKPKESEEKKESVQNGRQALIEAVEGRTTVNRVFSRDAVYDAIINTLSLSDDAELNVRDFLNSQNEELSAEEVDEALATIREGLSISDEALKRIEDIIIQSEDPRQAQMQTYVNEVETDLSTLASVVQNDLLNGQVKSIIIEVINDIGEKLNDVKNPETLH